MIDITLRKFAKILFKLKTPLYKLPTAFFTFIGILVLFNTALSQINDTSAFQGIDSSTIIPADTILENSNKKDDIEFVINYNSRDSMFFDVKSQTMILYGDAHADYGTINIDADRIEIDWKDRVLKATYSTDSLGNKIGVPVFTDKDDEYIADTIAYNVKTKKGYISNIYTQQNGDHIRTEKAYKDEHDHLYMSDATYCPCEDPNATTYIKTKKLKIIPEKRVYAGPGLLHIGNIPTPLGMPFGIFPVSGKKTSGLIIPDYNYSEVRGYFLSNGGFYWAANDYIGMKFLGSIYSNGGGGFSFGTDYKVRYRFSGNFDFGYTNDVYNADEYEPNNTVNYNLKWNHAPQSIGGRKFTANVNLASTQYYYRNEISTTTSLQNTMTSSIKYSMPLTGTPFSSSINLRHAQNNATGIYNFTLPDFTLTMNRIYPLRPKSSPKDYSFEPVNIIRDFYQSTSIGFSSSIKHIVSNNSKGLDASLPFEISNFDDRLLDTLDLISENFDELLERADLNINYSIPISTTLKLARGKIAFTPALAYNGYIYPEKYDYQLSPITDTSGNTEEAYAIDTIRSFNHAYQYSASVSTSTNIYGIYKFTKPGLPKFMHTMRPTVGMTFSPEFSSPELFPENYTEVYSPEEDTTYYISKYLGQTVPSGSKRSSLNFSLDNTLQMKKTKIDPIEDSSKSDSKTKIEPKTIIKKFTIRSSYNFAAEEFNLASFNIDGSASFIKDLISINYKRHIDPYEYQFDTSSSDYETKINNYAWNAGQGIGNLTYQSVNISTSSINPKKLKQIFGTQKSEEPIEEDSAALLPEPNKSLYKKLVMPWSLSITYTYTQRRLGLTELGETDFSKQNTVSVRSSLDLTPEMKINFTFSYDLETKSVITPNVTVSRSLGCWETSLQWIPFGARQSFRFIINIKSPTLQNDLKYDKRKIWIDN